MFALDGLLVAAVPLSRYKPASAIHLLCKAFTTSSFYSSRNEARKEYFARYYRERKERDSNFLERCNENTKRYYHELEEKNPELYKRRLYRARENSAVKYQKPEVRRELLERSRKRYTNNHAVAQRKQMATWLVKGCPDHELFQWKGSVPVVYAERVRKTCASCGEAHRLGKRLWWRRKDPERRINPADIGKQPDLPDPGKHSIASELFDCHSCYTRDMSDMSRLMPVGHERHVFGAGMKRPRP